MNVTLVGGMHNGRTTPVDDDVYQLDFMNNVDGKVVTSIYKPDPADRTRFLLDTEDSHDPAQ